MYARRLPSRRRHRPVRARTRWLARVLLLFAASCLGACGGESASPPAAPPGPPALFTDVTAEAGIDFVHVNGAFGKRYFPEVMGGGCAFLDYDGDGAQDILFVNSTYWYASHRKPDGPRDTMALYRNDGRGRFRDVSHEAGMDLRFYGLGVAVGDVDGDGDPDVVLTGVGGNRYLRNDEGRFVDATAGSGLEGYAEDYNTSAGFFDADGDGDLDLFICDYVLWSKEIDDRIGFRIKGFGRVYSPPWVWAGRHAHYYRNEGDGTFRDVSKEAGIEVATAEGKPAAKGLAVTFVDLDDDGDLDVYMANDTVPNFLFRNRGDGTFEEIGHDLGVALAGTGRPTGAMGLDVADLDGDGGLAIGVGNWSSETNSLFMRQPGGTTFNDRAGSRGLGTDTLGLVTFGFFFFDFDLDGWLDAFQTNGGLEAEGHRLEPPLAYEQPSQLFHGVRKGRQGAFELVPPRRSGVARPVVGRGAAYADIDGDGDLDVLVAQIAGPALLLRNDQQTGHHWLRLRLVGDRKNRDAIGAWAEVEAGGQRQRRQVMPTRSYCTQVELPLTFGLGTNTSVESVRVRWPDGTRQDVPVEGIDRLVVVRKTP